MEFRFLMARGYDSNIIVVENGGEALVVDSGTGGWRPDLGLGDSVVKALVLTHIHYDHSGGAAELSSRLSAPVFIHAAEIDQMRTGDGWTSAARMFGCDLATPGELKPLKEGDTFDLGGEQLRVIHLPGHSPGSIALYSEKDRVLVCGDTIFACHDVGRWDLPGGSLSDLRGSIKRLKGLDFNLFYPGHGPAGTKKDDFPPRL